MRKILLVSPSNRADPLDNVKTLSLPPLGLAQLAACTPARYEVQIVDEALERIDFDGDVDLVGISCVTPLAPRAYEIAARFRERGALVVLGGIHPSMMPAEAAAHADAVAAGEAEAIWPAILRDAEAGALGPVYHADPPSLERLPLPRRDLLPRGYFVQTVQTSRGCPFNCHFCSVTRFNGGQYRFRPVEDVIEEIRQIRERRFFFIDDNIVGSGKRCRERAARLFERLQGMGKVWGSQSCISIAEDPELLRRAARSGARVFFIGFESTEEASLRALNKQVNLRSARGSYRDAIRAIHDHGIAVVGGFMLGTDHDTPETFDRVVDFVQESGIDGVQLTVQTPLPGTRLYEQLAAEGRLLYRSYPRDWRQHNVFEVVFQPRHMSVEELRAGQVRAYRATASLGPSLARSLGTLRSTRSLLGAAVAFSWSYGCYRAITRRERSALRWPTPWRGALRWAGLRPG